MTSRAQNYLTLRAKTAYKGHNEKKWGNAMDNQFSTSFDVAVHEDMHGQWIVEAIATTDGESPVRRTRFSGHDARDRAYAFAARKYGLTPA